MTKNFQIFITQKIEFISSSEVKCPKSVFMVLIPTFPILCVLAYTTGLGYRPTCEIGLYRSRLRYCDVGVSIYLTFNSVK